MSWGGFKTHFVRFLAALGGGRLLDTSGSPGPERPSSRVLVQGRAAMLIAVDPGGLIRSINDTVTRLLGYHASDLVGQPYISILVPGSGTRTEELRLGECVIGVEQTYIRKDGSLFPALASGFLLQSPAGDVELVWLVREHAAKLPAVERLHGAEEGLQRSEAERRRMAAELRELQQALERERRERRRLEEEQQNQWRGDLWAWAEEELKRVQGSLKQTRERLYKTEEDLERLKAERESAERRRRSLEEELQRLRDEAQRGTMLRAQSGWIEPPVSNAANHNGRAGTDSDARAIVTAQRERLGSNGSALAFGHDAEGAIDWSAALAGIDGDLEFLRAVAGVFEQDLPGLLAGLRDALDHGERQSIEQTARQLRGAALGFGANAVVQAAQRLEAVARQGALSEAEDAYISLQLEIERLRPALKSLRDG